MGLWDLIKEGAEFVGDKYKDFSGEVNKFKAQYSNYDDETLKRLFNSTSGARKIAIASILKERGIVRR